MKKAFLAALSCSAALAVACPARANGRYPIAGELAVDPDDENHLALRTTFGLLVTKNYGADWKWICEPAIGIESYSDPMVEIAKGGGLLAGVFSGLSVSNDFGCSWSFNKQVGNKYVVDLALDKVEPTEGVLIVSNGLSADKFRTELWQTSDAGATWAQAGVDMPPAFLGLTVDSAPSDGQTVYASGRVGPPNYQGVLEVTTDRGAHWTSVDITGSDQDNLPYIGAVDPQDPMRLYVRIDSADHDLLLYTTDAGMTWTQAFKAEGDLFGFALSPDGSKVAIGGDKDGIWVAETSTMKFVKASKYGARCLKWTAAGLYACADQPVDGFELGISKDEGKTFKPLYHLEDLCGPPDCPADSQTAKQCPVLWGAIALTIMSDCGTGGAGGAATSTTAAASSSSAGGGDATSSSGGCGCVTAGSGARDTFAIGLGSLCLAAVWGRRRRLRVSRRRGSS